ncbi:hypothetical protein LUZ62_088043 [Rhynchospora pubera]|uniref:J domain-containing protein n=1 Tax=Rhynchospora pubera TaxID=906938 RepID=A0AAV8CHY1_9POAL|nr:hypothetical protein LUZ62_088043 [Rhynchospora pubera]
MDSGGAGSNGSCYYSLLGLRKNASSSDIRTAYRKLALKWHPDRWAKDPSAAGEAKKRFQRIQEAYSVLSDKGKRAMYDAGLFDPLDDDDQDFSDFMQEMLVMMDNVKNEVGASLSLTARLTRYFSPCFNGRSRFIGSINMSKINLLNFAFNILNLF